jgi:hypothetical protein
VDYFLKRGATYAIVYDFGNNSHSRLIDTRRRQMQAYRDSGLTDSSRQVLTESLNVIGMTWMHDTTLNEELFAQLAGVLFLKHHRFGVVAQEEGYGEYGDTRGIRGGIRGQGIRGPGNTGEYGDTIPIITN